jgi:hypothetical protein
MLRPLSPVLILSLATTLAGCTLIDRMDGVAQARRLHAAGLEAQATVLKVWDTGITVNEDPVVGLEVEVYPKDAPSFRATILKSLVSRIDLSRFQPGQVIPVRYDAKDPKQIALDLYTYP